MFHKKRLTKIFEEKGSLSSEKNISAYFPPSIEHDKNEITLFKGPQKILTITGEVIRSNL